MAARTSLSGSQVIAEFRRMHREAVTAAGAKLVRFAGLRSDPGGWSSFHPPPCFPGAIILADSPYTRLAALHLAHPQAFRAHCRENTGHAASMVLKQECMPKRTKPGTPLHPGQPISLRTLGEYLDLSPATISLDLNNASGVRSIPQETRHQTGSSDRRTHRCFPPSTGACLDPEFLGSLPHSQAVHTDRGELGAVDARTRRSSSGAI